MCSPRLILIRVFLIIELYLTTSHSLMLNCADYFTWELPISCLLPSNPVVGVRKHWLLSSRPSMLWPLPHFYPTPWWCQSWTVKVLPQALLLYGGNTYSSQPNGKGWELGRLRLHFVLSPEADSNSRSIKEVGWHDFDVMMTRALEEPLKIVRSTEEGD